MGKRIKAEREAQGLTQQQLADQVKGLDQSSLQKIEQRDSSSSKHAPGIARALNININWLLTGEGNKQIDKSMGVEESPAEYAANTDNMRKATNFVLQHIDFEVLKSKGPEWTAAAIIKLYDLYNDPGFENLTDETILKLIK